MNSKIIRVEKLLFSSLLFQSLREEKNHIYKKIKTKQQKTKTLLLKHLDSLSYPL